MKKEISKAETKQDIEKIIYDFRYYMMIPYDNNILVQKNEKLQKLTGILGLNTVAMEYLHAFMRFQMMMGDISKSIGDVVKEVAGE